MVPGFLRSTAGPRGGVDLLYVMEPLLLWSSFGPCLGIGAQGVPVPLAGSGIEPRLLAVGLACGLDVARAPSSVAIQSFPLIPPSIESNSALLSIYIA